MGIRIKEELGIMGPRDGARKVGVSGIRSRGAGIQGSRGQHDNFTMVCKKLLLYNKPGQIEICV